MTRFVLCLALFALFLSGCGGPGTMVPLVTDVTSDHSYDIRLGILLPPEIENFQYAGFVASGPCNWPVGAVFAKNVEAVVGPLFPDHFIVDRPEQGKEEADAYLRIVDFWFDQSAIGTWGSTQHGGMSIAWEFIDPQRESALRFVSKGEAEAGSGTGLTTASNTKKMMQEVVGTAFLDAGRRMSNSPDLGRFVGEMKAIREIRQGRLSSFTDLEGNYAWDREFRTTAQGTSALMEAARYGNDALVQSLLDNGEGAEETSKDGMTALTYASMGGHASTVKILLDHGADAARRDRFGNDPLLYALVAGHEPMADLLRAKAGRTGSSDLDRASSEQEMVEAVGSAIDFISWDCLSSWLREELEADYESEWKLREEDFRELPDGAWAKRPGFWGFSYSMNHLSVEEDGPDLLYWLVDHVRYPDRITDRSYPGAVAYGPGMSPPDSVRKREEVRFGFTSQVFWDWRDRTGAGNLLASLFADRSPKLPGPTIRVLDDEGKVLESSFPGALPLEAVAGHWNLVIPLETDPGEIRTDLRTLDEDDVSALENDIGVAYPPGIEAGQAVVRARIAGDPTTRVVVLSSPLGVVLGRDGEAANFYVDYLTDRPVTRTWRAGGEIDVEYEGVRAMSHPDGGRMTVEVRTGPLVKRFTREEGEWRVRTTRGDIL